MYCIKPLEPIFKATETREKSFVQPSAVGVEDGSPCLDLASSRRLSATADEASSSLQSSAVGAEDGSLCFAFAPGRRLSAIAVPESSSVRSSAVGAGDGSPCIGHLRRPIFEGEPDPNGPTDMRMGLLAQGLDVTRRGWRTALERRG